MKHLPLALLAPSLLLACRSAGERPAADEASAHRPEIRYYEIADA